MYLIPVKIPQRCPNINKKMRTPNIKNLKNNSTKEMLRIQ